MSITYSIVSQLVKRAESNDPYAPTTSTASPIQTAASRFDEYEKNRKKDGKDHQVGSVNQVPNSGFSGDATGVVNTDTDAAGESGQTQNLSLPEYCEKTAIQTSDEMMGTIPAIVTAFTPAAPVQGVYDSAIHLGRAVGIGKAPRTPAPPIGTPEYAQWLEEGKKGIGIAGRLGELGNAALSVIPGAAAIKGVGRGIGKIVSKVADELPEMIVEEGRTAMNPAIQLVDTLDDVGRMYMGINKQKDQHRNKAVPAAPTAQFKEAADAFTGHRLAPTKPTYVPNTKAIPVVESNKLAQSPLIQEHVGRLASFTKSNPSQIIDRLKSNPDVLQRLLKHVGSQLSRQITHA